MKLILGYDQFQTLKKQAPTLFENSRRWTERDWELDWENLKTKGYPWEEELLGKISDCVTFIKTIEKDYNYNLHGGSENHYEFDIKYYDSPDLKTDEDYRMWDEFISQTLDDFKDSIDIGWVEDVGQTGRSGGWLTIVPDSSYDINTIREELLDKIVEYNLIVYRLQVEYNPVIDAGWDFDLFPGAEDFEELKEASESLMSVVQEKHSELERILSDLKELKKLIATGLEGLSSSYEEWKKEMEDE